MSPASSTDTPGASPDRVVVGRIARAHGLAGEVAVEIRTDLPERRFTPGNVLHCDHAQTPSLTVTASRPHSGRLLVTFAEVRDRTVAEALRGCLLSIDAAAAGPASADPGDDDADDEAAEAWWDRDLIGLQARAVDGAILGRVTDVVHTPGGELLVVARREGGELLVPFVRDIVPTVDLAAGTLLVDPPPGLLEL